jgi:phosphate uptake regulator
MMKRKLIQLSTNTLVVSLPSTYTKKFGLIKGDEVNIEENERDLIISNDKSRKLEGNVTVNIPNAKNFLRRVVDNPYRLGFEEATFHYPDSEIYSLIQKEVSNLIGFEIVEQGKNYCKVKSLSKGIDDEFESSIHRLIRITIQMMQDVLESLENKDFESLSSIEKVENQNNKFAHFGKRMINLRGYKDTRKITLIYRTICLFEEVGDDLRDICRFYTRKEITEKSKTKIDQRSLTNFKEIILQIKEYYKLFKKYEEKKIFDYGKNDKRIEKNSINLIENNIDPVLNNFLRAILNKTKHLTEDLFNDSMINPE